MKNSRDLRFKGDLTFLWILPLGSPSDLRWKRILSWVWQWGGKEESLGNKARVFSITKAYSPGRRLCQSQVLPKGKGGHFAQSSPLYPSCLNPGLPRWWCSSKEPACQSRRLRRCGFSPWVGKIPWRRAWQPTPVFLPGKSHGQRCLVGYSPGVAKNQIWLSRHMHLSSRGRSYSVRGTTWVSGKQAPWKGGYLITRLYGASPIPTSPLHTGPPQSIRGDYSWERTRLRL